MASILDAASKKNNVSITQLTYWGLLSHRQIISNLQPIITARLLIHNDNMFSITEKGRDFLRIYNNLVAMLHD